MKYVIGRFDHSPCDPTINLKGCPSQLFACAGCGHHFQTKEAWRTHLESKVVACSLLCIINHFRKKQHDLCDVVPPRCLHLPLMVTASHRDISALCVLPALLATSSSTCGMNVYSTCQPETISPCRFR